MCSTAYVTGEYALDNDDLSSLHRIIVITVQEGIKGRFSRLHRCKLEKENNLVTS